MRLHLIECEEDPHTKYVELDGVRLIFRDGLLVGWYDPRLDEVLN